MDLTTLAQNVCNAVDDAMNKCVAVRNKDVLMTIGCTGSGKSTVSVYSQGVDFKYSAGELAAQKVIDGFEIGARRASVTRGLSVAEVPNTNGLLMVDLAGTGDTSGAAAELCGAIYRSTVLQAARSVRIILVMSLDRAKISNERGKPAVRDVEYVASLFKDVTHHLESIGLVVTSDPMCLTNSGATSVILNRISKAMEDLEKHATPVAGLCTGEHLEGMKITPAGMTLLQYLCKHCQDAQGFLEWAEDEEDSAVLMQLLQKHCVVYPVNVLKEDQRMLFQQYFKSVKPVVEPKTAFVFTLPIESQNELQALLNKEFANIRTLLGCRGVNWASDEELVSPLFNLLQFSAIMEEKGILPWTTALKAELYDQLLSQNMAATSLLLEGVSLGNVNKLENALHAMAAMDAFVKRVPALTLSEWSTSDHAKLKGVESAKKAIETLLPEDFSEVKWNPVLAKRVCNILSASERLGDVAVPFLTSKGEKLVKHVLDLQSRAAECTNSKAVVHAFACLQEHKEYLQETVAVVLCKYVSTNGIANILDETKALVMARLKSLSQTMVEERRHSQNSKSWELLEQMCKDTEIACYLGEDLENVFMMQPLSSALAPSQDEVDSLCREIHCSPPEEWNFMLSDLVQRLNAAGRFSLPMLTACGMQCDHLLDTIRSEVASAKDLLKAEAARLRGAQPRVASIALSVKSGGTDQSDDDLQTGLESDEEAVEALEKLEMLLPADSLLWIFNRPAADTAVMALKTVGYTLKKTVETLLKRAQKARDKAWLPSGLDCEVVSAMRNLKASLTLAKSSLKVLHGVDGASLNNLPAQLKEFIDESESFIEGAVKKEVEAWTSATTMAKGWRQIFLKNFQMANKLRPLLPAEVVAARQRLHQKVTEWHQHCLSNAIEASEYDEKWHDFIHYAVYQGMDFEESSLCEILQFQPEFRLLVNNQAEKWQKGAATAERIAKFASWQKLTALMAGLEQLGEKDARTVKLCKDLRVAREPLDADLNDSECRFLQALQEERYPEAYRLLSIVPSSSKHCETLKGRLVEVLEMALHQVCNDGEVEDVVQAAKRARSLIQDCGKLLKDDRFSQLQALLQSLDDGLTKRAQESLDDLQRALEGSTPPTRALSISAVLNGKSRAAMAEEALVKFISTKKLAFDHMNCFDLVTWIIRHDGACKSLPEELRSNMTAYEELIKQFYMCFKAAFKKELDSLQAYQDNQEWGKAKQLHQQLRDAVDSIQELDVLKAVRTPIRNLKNLMGVGGVARTKSALEEVERGEFSVAIWALVTGDGNNTEELCEAINAKVTKNMNVLAADKASLHTRLSILKSFLEAVGDHPPDELRGLWREVQGSYQRTKPLVEEQAGKAVEAGLEAASGSELDLVRLARALVQFRHFEGAVAESERKQLTQAVYDFWQRVVQHMQKVGSEIHLLEVQSLTLSLEPLRHWLHSFAQLNIEERQLLLANLRPRPADLQSWMREVLREPLLHLLNANKVQNEMESQNFSDVSRRYKVSEKLHLVLNTVCLNLEPVRLKALHMKDTALQALSHKGKLQQYNSAYKFLKNVASELPEVPVSSHVNEVEKAFCQIVLDVYLQRINSSQAMQHVVQAIIELRNVANQAPDAYEHVMLQLKTCLNSLREDSNFGSKGINALGAELTRNQVGNMIITEHPDIFGEAKDMHHNLIFRRAGETHRVEELLLRLTRESESDDYVELRCALEKYENIFADLASKYLMQGQAIESVLHDAKFNLDSAAANCESKHPESSIVLLAHLAMSYSLIKCGKEFIKAPIAEKDNKFVKPHRVQILTIFRLLQIHKQSKSDSLWKWVLGVVLGSDAGADTKRKPQNHLAQVLTGEGKCLTLGLLASFLALNGVESDIVCYRRFLIEQDYRAMRPFYDFVGVAEKIKYATFEDLCQERLESIKAASKGLLYSAPSCFGRQLRDVSKRALLIDEVDVFLGRRFYGQTWDGGFKLDTPEAVALVKFIHEEKRVGRPVRNILKTEVFNNLLRHTPHEMHDALAGVAMVLTSSIDEWATPEPILNERLGKIGYKENDDVNYDLSYSNKTVFAYLSYEMDGKITSEKASKHLGMDLFCGRFSFAELPKEYLCILGVSGTLRELLDFKGIRNMLEKEYRFKHYTYAPSIFGERRLTYREAEHFSILDNESDWLSRIESVIEDEKRCKNAVLVFFKNESDLKKFPGWSNFEFLTERVDPVRRNGYVAAATAEGRVTLMTKAFGRGIDFQMPEGHQLVVVQTFLSSLISEETQIKFRTARQGKPGQYRLVVCAEHLEAKMGFEPKDIQLLKTGRGGEIRELLRKKQQEKTKAKSAGLTQRRLKAAQLEQDTKAWEELLFKPNATANQKLVKLAGWNGNELFEEAHYSLLLDKSYSMQGEPWRQLICALNKFLQQLLSDPRSAAATKISVIPFNNAAHAVNPTHAKVEEVQDIDHHQPSGGTNFGAAFAECHKVIGRSAPHVKELIIFLTDGMAKVPTDEITLLLADHKHRIKSFTCVGFGHGADAASLKHILELFELFNISSRLVTPCDRDSLVQTFVEAAKSRAIHT